MAKRDSDEQESAGGETEKPSGFTIRIPKALLIVLGILILAGAGVGAYFAFRSTETCISGESGEEISCESDDALSQAEYDEQQAEEAEEQAAIEKARAKADECEGQTNALLREVRELNSRLSVGLPYADYSEQVGSIRVAYDQVPFGNLDLDCGLEVGIPLEDALNSYVKAGNTWGDCIEDFNCDVDAIDPELQDKWNAATEHLDDATSGLRDLAKP